MQLSLKSPLVIFDLETTGTSISKDRIIEYSFIKVSPGNDREIKTSRLNPEMPIPKESSLIHGIFDEDIKDAPTFKTVARNLAKWLEGCDLGGFNLIKFDIPILVEEFLRAEVNFETRNRKIIDSQRLFHIMEKRTLSAAYQFYCNETLENAHSAEADATATLQVLEAQLERYENQPVIDNQGKQIGVIRNDVEALHNLSFTNMIDLAGRIVLNHQGIAVFNFGKHKGKPVSEVLNKEPSYFDWMMKGDFTQDTKRRLTEIRLQALKQ